jgi:deazaflavin-dependent oxidoreductase (nitroreductase family)
LQTPISKLDPTRPPLRWLLRFPSFFYKANLGWLLGERFVQLTVRGRKTQLPRQVVLEVVGREPSTGDLIIASAWGSGAQWFRNLQQEPRAHVRVGRRRFTADVSVLSEEAAATALREYARVHPWAYRWFIGPLLLGRRPTGRPEEFADLTRDVPLLVVRAGDFV